MLQKLLVKNYTIIRVVEIEFTEGLNIITGETGAGKSILLGALGLIMGRRADGKSLFNREKKCIIEGTFKVAESYRPFFEAHDIDFGEETQIRREITPSGKSRAFINDTPTTLSVLKRLTSALVDLHQQFDTLDIHQVSFQLNVVDALAGHSAKVQAYRKEYAVYDKNKKRLLKLQQQRSASSKETDFLQFQLNEFEEAGLVANEGAQAETELKNLSNAEDIKRILGESQQFLAERENAVVGQLKDLSFRLQDICKYSPPALQLREKLEGLAFELEDLAGEMGILAEQTAYDPQRIQEIRERLDLIYRLQNKHQATSVEGLLEIQTEISDKLNALGDLSGQIHELEEHISRQEGQLLKRARKLSQKRHVVIPAFEKRIKGLLADLSMPYAQLKVQADKLEQLTPDGVDQIEFLFAANKGGRLDSIKDVASGGELARLTLCIKSLVAGALALPTMIFDEIDTGVSGDVALKMGGILKSLAKGHQIISITHTPQIAVQADRHFFVFKDHGGEQTTTNVKTLSHSERVTEIAIMLSGNPPTENALRNAEELMAR